MTDLTRMAFGTPMFSRRPDAGYLEEHDSIRDVCERTRARSCGTIKVYVFIIQFGIIYVTMSSF
jgi:hypothetical protein